jgi:hypothetical protein
LILRLISATFWLGGMDDVVEGDWRWVSQVISKQVDKTSI